ncbi:MAG TPA: asparagine synthase (glutamine-hydrolyzing) [Chryseolinea sp.]|nr:asparagine synthase (glutamine-hydrolyzing) [Chryseolinea sp.]
MCGILGQLTFKAPADPVPPLSAIAHRGPDGNGEWTNKSGDVYLGHVRLAILDPTPTGAQPMTDSSKRFTITFNGEIYNHLGLRPMLPNVAWRGTSDTETLVELFAVKGLECLQYLKGMFAFAIHDGNDNSITLVRDRLGIKPLWVKTTPHYFSFASEVRALIKSGDFTPNTQFLNEYIGFGRIPSTDEIFDGIQSVAPGGWMKLNINGTTQKDNWWPGRKFAVANVSNHNDAVKRVRQLVTTAIEEHLISDVGVGAFLSGGIDSSIVTLVAGKELGRNLRTFTVGFPQVAFDERSVAKLVAKKAGSDHCEIEVSENTCLQWVMEAVARLDLPSVDAINTYIVSKAVTDKGLKVALSGLGGDEIFAGYPSFRHIPMIKWLGNLPAAMSKQLIGLAPRSLREKLIGLNSFGIPELTVARRRFTSIPSLRELGFGEIMPSIPTPPDGLDTIGLISWYEMQSYMIPMLLRDSDQMSMAVGLEIRVPFLDHCLVEEALTLPQQYKMGKGVKPLLVEAFKDELPREVYDRPKQGFALPMADWIRGPLESFTNDGVQAASDWLGLAEPLHQKEGFYKGNLHWTRVWHWAVLGHWLINQKSPVRDLASVA